MKKIYEGKARDIYEVDNNLVLVATDRISMHIPLPFKVKYKGQVLNKMAEFWFNKYSNIIQNHMITTDVSKMPDYFQDEKFTNRCMLVKKLKMLPFECIVRGHITGTCWDCYKNGKLVLGDELLTPDCSRFWLAKDFKIGNTQTNFDREELKQYVKNNPITKENIDKIPKEIIDKISQKYLDIYELITNQKI